jgi:CDP-L-myo-inositol myo-inositolphosphotransferase
MLSGPVVTQTIILAAGSGTRLTGTDGVPKPLMDVGGLPLVAHALEHARVSGCTDAVIVIGHEGARVRRAVEEMTSGLCIQFVENTDPTSPNGVSLLTAEPLAAPVFYLQMVDHVFAESALPNLTALPWSASDGCRVLIDRHPRHLDLSDATRVRLAASRVCAIGKKIEPWDAIDAGCFVLTRTVFDALRRAPATEPRTVSSGMRRLAAEGQLGWAEVNGIEWADVDTPEDRQAAERLVQRLLTARSR